MKTKVLTCLHSMSPLLSYKKTQGQLIVLAGGMTCEVQGAKEVSRKTSRGMGALASTEGMGWGSWVMVR